MVDILPIFYNVFLVIFLDITDVAAFAAAHPNEIIILDFGNRNQGFVEKDSNPNSFNNPMSDLALQNLSENIFLPALPRLMVQPGFIAENPNPTVGDTLATGRNIFFLVREDRLINANTG